MTNVIKIAIQGGRASFHDIAARQYFKNINLTVVECRTFRLLCKELLENRVDFAVMAIENTLVGSILPNYSLLLEFPLHIVGEIYLHIQQNFMALPHQSISDIEYVRSHPMALLQCSEFLESNLHIREVETFDTAESAREIREKQMHGVAAIASREAAELYGLNILAEEIENLKRNYTRFLILANEPHHQSASANKASINFHVRHRVGALAEILNVLQQHGVNLTLIQSIAVPGSPREYAIHVDVEWSDKAKFEEAAEQAKQLSQEFKVLGIYKAGIIPI